MPIDRNGKEHPMTNWQQLLYIFIGILLFAAFVYSAINKHRSRKQRDFTRSLETLLQPKENVKVICSQSGFRCILTNKRVIFEKKGGYTAFPIKNVKKVQGTNEKGNRTTVPAKMVTLTIQIDRDYTLKNTGEDFQELAKELLKKTAPKKPKKVQS